MYTTGSAYWISIQRPEGVAEEGGVCVWQKRGRGCGRAYSGGYLGQRRGEGVSEGGKGVAEGGRVWQGGRMWQSLQWGVGGGGEDDTFHVPGRKKHVARADRFIDSSMSRPGLKLWAQRTISKRRVVGEAC